MSNEMSNKQGTESQPRMNEDGFTVTLSTMREFKLMKSLSPGSNGTPDFLIHNPNSHQPQTSISVMNGDPNTLKADPTKTTHNIM
jgi:hypothetical protein